MLLKKLSTSVLLSGSRSTRKGSAVRLSKPPNQLNPLTREIKESDGTPASPRMVRRGGDAARVQALLAADATDCWHLHRWWHPCLLGARPPALRSQILSIQFSAFPYLCAAILRIILYPPIKLIFSVCCVQVLSKSEVRPFCCLNPCLSCRSKNNGPKEPQVGVMRSNLNELNISPARAALQPGVRTAEYSSL